MSGPSKELLIRREKVKDARIAALEARVENLVRCNNEQVRIIEQLKGGA